MLDQLTPGQKQALAIGVPIVAALAIGTTMGKRRAADAASAGPPEAAIPPTVMPSTDAISTGELADFQSAVTNALTAWHGRWEDRIARLEDDAPAPVGKPPPPVTVIAPPHAPSSLTDRLGSGSAATRTAAQREAQRILSGGGKVALPPRSVQTDPQGRMYLVEASGNRTFLGLARNLGTGNTADPAKVAERYGAHIF